MAHLRKSSGNATRDMILRDNSYPKSTRCMNER